MLPEVNKDNDLISKINPKAFKDPIFNPNVEGGSEPAKVLTLSIILRIILRNLENQSPKIAWNSCVAIGNAAVNPSFSHDGNGKEIFDKFLAIQPLMNVLVDKSNFKIRIHASQTLLKYQSIEQLGGQEGYLIAWTGLLSSFETLSTYNSFQDEKYVRKLDQNFIELFLHFTSFLELSQEHS